MQRVGAGGERWVLRVRVKRVLRVQEVGAAGERGVLCLCERWVLRVGVGCSA